MVVALLYSRGEVEMLLLVVLGELVEAVEY